jgi:hypothetical protein
VELALIRDVLDALLIDRDGEPMGRVDGIVMSWRPDAAPHITHLELGGATMVRRLPRRLRTMAEWIARKLSPRTGDPYRIEVARIVHFGKRIELDIDASRSAARATERWVRDHIIARIPWS